MEEQVVLSARRFLVCRAGLGAILAMVPFDTRLTEAATSIFWGSSRPVLLQQRDAGLETIPLCLSLYRTFLDLIMRYFADVEECSFLIGLDEPGVLSKDGPGSRRSSSCARSVLRDPGFGRDVQSR
jgi:hypothetical protein